MLLWCLKNNPVQLLSLASNRYSVRGVWICFLIYLDKAPCAPGFLNFYGEVWDGTGGDVTR